MCVFHLQELIHGNLLINSVVKHVNFLKWRNNNGAQPPIILRIHLHQHCCQAGELPRVTEQQWSTTSDNLENSSSSALSADRGSLRGRRTSLLRRPPPLLPSCRRLWLPTGRRPTPLSIPQDTSMSPMPKRRGDRVLRTVTASREALFF
ncbi:uncharacterized protein LOC124366831 [Homalodisca vitripennis]|uniref:uncharacterized protein LOC124366831 n=1 Tax=Homalodisca vitripennis TaxID=197043 RepID=UPI001EE9E007|nr:uncharacterized protein LOC124366831 [Homalodisca vitripennis]